MQFSAGLLAVALSTLITPPVVLAGSSCPCREDHASKDFHNEILNNYLDIWNGQISLINSTFDPEVVVYSDRFPSSTGKGSGPTTITNRHQFTAFVQRARIGWETYEFTPIRSVENEKSIAVRWKMNGILGHDFSLFPTPLKAGSSVTYNGTDFLALDGCTGKIRELYIAQDLISYFYAMGLDAVTV